MNQTMYAHDTAAQPLADDAPVQHAEQLRRPHGLAVVQKEIIELAAGGASSDVLLNALVRAAQGLTKEGARAAVFIIDPEGATLRFSATAGM